MKETLSEKQKLPAFSKIESKLIEPALDTILTNNRKQINKLLKQKIVNWENIMMPLEELDDNLNQFWAPIQHLHSVMNTKALRKVYNRCLPKLTEYHTEISQNTQLYKTIQQIAESKDYKKLDKTQHKIIKDELRDFKLSGVTLDDKNKKIYAKLIKQLSKLETKFEENVLDATHAWFYHTTNKKELKGLPAFTMESAEHAAKNKKLKGWVLTLDFPVYYSIMSHADNRQLRKTMYEAYVTRASELGPNANKYNNSKIMEKVITIKEKIAKLVGYDNYADYSLATKMANDPQEVFDFLNDLAKKSKPVAKKEFKKFEDFVQKNFKLKKLQAWDHAYFSEKLRKKKFNISQEDLRPYFPEDKVLNGLFKLVEKIFAIKIRENKAIDKWHEDVRYFEVYDQSNKMISSFYTDLYARELKHGGAWMDDCRDRRMLRDGSIQRPIAFLTCNFSKPSEDRPSLLTHDEVDTLFHEFGHCLQLLLTKVDYPEASGINGVEWDAVELPSQFMENFCWQKEGLDLISGHYQTGKPLPKQLLKRLIESKNFHAGLQMIRQIIFSLFDFRLYSNPSGKPNIQKVLDHVRKELSVFPVPKFNRFQHSFGHIFAGGYAAGYYSYKWAEVLSSDAFSLFEENGVLDKKTGLSFKRNILEKGGSRKAIELFIKFRGRKPTIEALLKQAGILK